MGILGRACVVTGEGMEESTNSCTARTWTDGNSLHGMAAARVWPQRPWLHVLGETHGDHCVVWLAVGLAYWAGYVDARVSPVCKENICTCEGLQSHQTPSETASVN